METVERRLVWLSLGLSAAGSLAAWACFGAREGLSFAGGAAVGGGELLWLRSSIGKLFVRGPRSSTLPVLAGYFLRLLLIPLSLYVMIRFLIVDVIAAVIGMMVLIGSVLVEGVLEAFGSNPK
jgi:hypothetical protein